MSHSTARAVDPDPDHFGNPDPDSQQKNQDPDTHQSGKLDPDPDPHQFADDIPKCMAYEPIRALYQGV